MLKMCLGLCAYTSFSARLLTMLNCRRTVMLPPAGHSRVCRACVGSVSVLLLSFELLSRNEVIFPVLGLNLRKWLQIFSMLKACYMIFMWSLQTLMPGFTVEASLALCTFSKHVKNGASAALICHLDNLIVVAFVLHTDQLVSVPVAVCGQVKDQSLCNRWKMWRFVWLTHCLGRSVRSQTDGSEFCWYQCQRRSEKNGYIRSTNLKI